MVVQRYGAVVQNHYAQYRNFDTLHDTITTHYTQFIGEAFTPPYVSDAQGLLLYPRQIPPKQIVITDYRFRSIVSIADGEYVYLLPSDSYYNYPPMDRYPNAFLLVFGLMVLSAIVFSSIAMYLATIRMLQPISTLTKLSTIPLTTPQHFATQLPRNTADEIILLAHALDVRDNEISRQITLQQQLNVDISHELRNPLNVINGYVEAMRDGVLSANHIRLTIVHTEIQLLFQLIDNLRTLSLTDVNKLLASVTETPLQLLLADTCAQFAPLVMHKTITLTYSCNPHDAVLYVDKNQLLSVLHNIIENAIRHTAENGTISINATTTSRHTSIAISDNGSGIDANDLPHIFERFNRGTNPIGAGSGLGLAIVKAIVNTYHGTVVIESTINVGTTVTITLPHATQC